MAKYTLTPTERRIRAQAVKQQRASRYAVTDYIRAQREAEAERAAQLRQEQINAENEKNSQNFLTRTFHTIGDLAANVLTGAAKGLEGIYDFGAGIVGGIGGLFNKDFQDNVKEHIAYDWTGETLGKPMQEATKYSYLKDGGIVENVASGVGQMLPAVGLSLIPGVGQALSLGYLGASAAGNSTEEAFNDGAEYGQGLLYGVSSGAVEMATEKMWSGFGNITGKGFLDDVGKSVASTGARRVAKEAVQEGTEEIVSELANPALKAIYKGRDALEEYKDPEYWKDVGEAGLVGGLTSVAYGGTVGRVMHRSGRYADVNEAREEYETLRKKARNLEQSGRLDEVAKNGKTNRQNIYENEVENIRIIEDTIKKYDEGKREKFLKRTGLEGMFNKDGSVNADFAAREGLWSLVESSEEGDGKPVRPLANQPEQYRSAFADERAMQSALEQGRATAFEGEMTPEQESDFKDFKRAFGKIANKSEGSLKFIVANSMENGNAYLDAQTGTVVIGADQFGKGKSGVDLANSLITSDMWQKSVVHEVKHSTEGTKNDTKLNRHLYSDDAVFEAACDSFIKRGYFEQKFGKDTQKAREYLDDLLKKVPDVLNGKPANVSGEEWLSSNLTVEELEDYRTAQSEISAIAAENVLGNEDFIKKLLQSDSNLAQKLLNRISDMKDAFKSLQSKDARAAYTYLQKAEKLYLKAIEEVGGYYANRRIVGLRKEEEDEEFEGSDAAEEGGDGAQEVKFSIQRVDGKEIVVIDTAQDIFEGVPRSEYGKVVRAYMRENFRGKTVEGVSFTRISEKEYTNSEYSKEISQKKQTVYDAKMRASTELDNLVRTGEFIRHEEARHPHEYNSEGYNRYSVSFVLDGKAFTGELLVALNGVKAMFYDVVKIKEEGVSPTSSQQNARLERGETTPSTISISQNSEKSTVSDKNSSGDTKFSRKEGGSEDERRLSAAQWNKIVANHTRSKVYSRGEAQQVIDSVISERLNFDEKYGVVRGRDKIVDLLFERFNSPPIEGMTAAAHRRATAIDIADYIIENSYLENALKDNEDLSRAAETLDAIRQYMHKVDLSGIKDEIEYKFDKKNAVNLVWGAKEGGISPDVIAQELRENGIFLEANNEADLFFEMLDVYHEARARIEKETQKIKLSEYGSEDQLDTIREQIEKDIMSAFETSGKPSAIAKERAQNAEQKEKLLARNAELRTRISDQKQQFREIIEKYKKRLSEVRNKNKTTNRLLDSVQKIKNWKRGTFVNRSKFRPKLFRGSIESLGKIKSRGNLNQRGTRKIVAGLSEWFVKENPILGYVDEEHTGYYNEEIAEILQAVSQNQKPLTEEQIDILSRLEKKSGFSSYKQLLKWYTKENLKKEYSEDVKLLLRELASETTFSNDELVGFDRAVKYFGHMIENYNRVYRNGKYVDAQPIAERYVETFKANRHITVGWMGKFFDKVFNNEHVSYLQTFADPMTVARYMDKYASGFYTEMLSEFRHGAIMADIAEMNLRAPLEEFLEKHKKYAQGIAKRTVTYREAELPALNALLLYMTLNRDQALPGLAASGFAFDNGKERVRVVGFAINTEEKLTLDDLRDRAAEERESLYRQFTEEDREFISVAEKIFESCRDVKRATDMLRMGYTNVIEGYYVPIRRANGAINVDTSTFYEEANRASDMPFNKDTVKGAKGELFIEGLDEVLGRHIHGISQYANLATVIDQYNIIYNLNLTEDVNKPTTVGTESVNVWKKGNDYFRKLISDIQGISPVRGGGSKLFGFFRGNYAKYQLGLNPKVWVTQLSSLFASSSIFDYSSLIKGFVINASDVDDYCRLAALRNNDNSAAMAQGVLENVGKVGDALMMPIGKMDRFVVKRLFGACQVQVAKTYKLEIGTEENKVKAGELLEKVILETQQNSIATERSAAMRSASEMMKTLTMFTADSMKVFGRLVDAVGEVSVLKHKLRAATDAGEVNALNEQLKQAYRKTAKSAAALASSAVFMALVAEAFRFIYGKDKEDDNIPVMMLVDGIGNLMGGLPLIKDLYARLTEGYELQNYSYSAINDLLDAFSGIVNFSEGKPAQKVKDVIFSVGQLFGIPTRNLYNIVYGLTKRISPSTAYGVDSVFYSKNYRSDLKKAIEREDDAMIGTIVGIMLDENIGEVTSSTARKELDRLVRAGYSVLPRSVGKTITYDGEETALSNRQVDQFKRVYSVANEAVANLMSLSGYQEADDAAKAKAVSFIYNTYYNLAVEDLLGVELESKNTLFAEAIDIEKLAIIIATVRSMTADIDKRGNTISGSKKKKIQAYINSLRLSAAQKYMIMGYLGYSNEKGKAQVSSYINGLSLSKNEKAKLLEYSGYAA